ncbi:MAG: hypothetical protein RSD97_04745 [Lachnospiraceae bacterium]
MKKEVPKRSSLFLLELIISILFFSLASAVCIQLFAKAHLQSNQTAELNMAVTKASSIAEIIRNSPDPIDALWKQFPQLKQKQHSLILYCDTAWNTCSMPKAFYVIEIHIKSRHQMFIGMIEIHRRDSTATLYHLTVKHHLPYTI